MLHVTATKDLQKGKDGDIVKVAGLVLVRQRPGTAGGICFITIEDETSVANLVVFKNRFENQYRKEILQSKLLMVQGKLQIEGQVIHVVVKHCEDWSKLLRELTITPTEKSSVETLPFPSENKRVEVRYTAEEENFPGARNFR